MESSNPSSQSEDRLNPYSAWGVLITITLSALVLFIALPAYLWLFPASVEQTLKPIYGWSMVALIVALFLFFLYEMFASPEP